MNQRLLNLHDQILNHIDRAVREDRRPEECVVHVEPFAEDVAAFQKEGPDAVSKELDGLIKDFACVRSLSLELPGKAASKKEISSSVPVLTATVRILWDSPMLKRCIELILAGRRTFTVEIRVRLDTLPGSSLLRKKTKDGTLANAAMAVVDRYLRQGTINSGLRASDEIYQELFQHAQVSMLPATVKEVTGG